MVGHESNVLNAVDHIPVTAISVSICHAGMQIKVPTISNTSPLMTDFTHNHFMSILIDYVEQYTVYINMLKTRMKIISKYQF